jgi:hypothetical protein
LEVELVLRSGATAGKNGIQERLEQLRAEALRDWRRAQRRLRKQVRRAWPAWSRRLQRAGVWAGRAALLLAFPFFVLVRVALSAHATYGAPTWLALMLSAAAVMAVLTAYAGWVVRRLAGRATYSTVAKTVAAPLAVGYTLYSLIFVSAGNTKTDDVRAEYYGLHPILRLAVSTLVLVDGDVLITDMTRLPEDYGRMKLPVVSSSRHLRQPDGYAHALDLRTRGRSFGRNLLTRAYFVMLGFRTLRHGGTEDHLHVELPYRR